MRKAFVLGSLAVFLLQSECIAQTAEKERRIEEEAWESLEPTELAILKKEKRFVMDYGFWINNRFSDFKDDDNESVRSDTTDKTVTVDQRFWFRATLRPPWDASSPNEHSFYFRLKDKHTWRDPADANGRYDWNGPHVDYLFLNLDLRPYGLQVGRRLYGIGQGIAYSNLNDGIEFVAAFATWSLTGLVSHTLPHEDNLDQSVPGGKKSGRTFYGIEGKYVGIPNHGLYGYVLFQRDDGEERPADAAQDFDYDSEYYAAGSEGKIIGNLRYAAELIFETGNSFTSTTNLKEEIRAWATNIGLTYDVQIPTQPTLYAEYAFGSGDSDRTNVTDTVSGNTVGDDTNFLYFGYLPTGYALSPRLSNLKMIKGGASFKPLEKIDFFKELTLAFDFYRYFKDESKGGIFDTQASESDRDVGFEIDLTLSWQILSDLGMAIEYGHFEPGDAYPAATNNNTDYFSLHLTTTF